MENALLLEVDVGEHMCANRFRQMRLPMTTHLSMLLYQMLLSGLMDCTFSAVKLLAYLQIGVPMLQSILASGKTPCMLVNCCHNLEEPR